MNCKQNSACLGSHTSHWYTALPTSHYHTLNPSSNRSVAGCSLRVVKMKFNLFTLLLVVAFICACHGAEIPPPTVPENGDVVRTYQGVNVYKTERACARQGGLCVQKDDCKSLTAIKGLCPENANRGVECCYEVNPPKGLRCRQYDGKCDRWCHRVQKMPAVDCAEGLVCCADYSKK